MSRPHSGGLSSPCMVRQIITIRRLFRNIPKSCHCTNHLCFICHYIGIISQFLHISTPSSIETRFVKGDFCKSYTFLKTAMAGGEHPSCHYCFVTNYKLSKHIPQELEKESVAEYVVRYNRVSACQSRYLL